MTTRPAPETLTAWRQFLTAHARLVAQLDAELQEHADLSLAWYDVLVALHEAPDQRLRMRDLANRVLITRSNCTRLVDRMAAQGLVQRLQDPDDRRGVVAQITKQGAATFRRAAHVHLRGIEQHFERPLDAKNIAMLGQALGAVVNALDTGSVNPPVRRS